MDWHALIASHPALEAIPPELREAAVCYSTTPGETLFRLGDAVHGMFCVVSGEVRLIRRARDGAEIVLQRSRTGFFAEASLGEKAYHCDAVVAEAGMVLRFPVAAFRTALHRNVTFRESWLAHLAREVRKLRAQCERLSLKSAPQRIIHYIEAEGTQGSVTLVQSRKAWAAELGITHEALYRTLRRLQEDNILQTDGRRITLRSSKRALPRKKS